MTCRILHAGVRWPARKFTLPVVRRDLRPTQPPQRLEPDHGAHLPVAIWHHRVQIVDKTSISTLIVSSDDARWARWHPPRTAAQTPGPLEVLRGGVGGKRPVIPS